jgi:hypothetical protein
MDAPAQRAGQQLQQPVQENLAVRTVNGTVAGVLSVFAFLYYVDVFLIVRGCPPPFAKQQATAGCAPAERCLPRAQIVPWLSYSVPGVTNLAVISATTGSAVFCYLSTMLTDPGRCGQVLLVHQHSQQQLTPAPLPAPGPLSWRQAQGCRAPPAGSHCRPQGAWRLLPRRRGVVRGAGGQEEGAGPQGAGCPAAAWPSCSARHCGPLQRSSTPPVPRRAAPPGSARSAPSTSPRAATTAGSASAACCAW